VFTPESSQRDASILSIAKRELRLGCSSGAENAPEGPWILPSIWARPPRLSYTTFLTRREPLQEDRRTMRLLSVATWTKPTLLPAGLLAASSDGRRIVIATREGVVLLGETLEGDDVLPLERPPTAPAVVVLVVAALEQALPGASAVHSAAARTRMRCPLAALASAPYPPWHARACSMHRPAPLCNLRAGTGHAAACARGATCDCGSA
jgi:hypothetical protein